MHVNGRNCSFFVDSGSQVSLIKSKFIQCNNLIRTEEYQLTGITGHSVEALGTSEIIVGTSEKLNCAVFKFIVCDDSLIQTDGILGRDFLRANAAEINFSEDKIKLWGKYFCMFLINDDQAYYNVHVNGKDMVWDCVYERCHERVGVDFNNAVKVIENKLPQNDSSFEEFNVVENVSNPRSIPVTVDNAAKVVECRYPAEDILVIRENPSSAAKATSDNNSNNDTNFKCARNKSNYSETGNNLPEVINVEVLVDEYGEVSDYDSDDENYYRSFAQREADLKQVELNRVNKISKVRVEYDSNKHEPVTNKMEYSDVILEDDLIMPPRCEVNCMGVIKNKLKGENVLIETQDIGINGVILARSLAHNDSKCNLRLINVRDEPITLKAKAKVGLACTNVKVLEAQCTRTFRHADLKDFHTDQIINQLDLSHLNTDVAYKVRGLIQNYSDIFSNEDEILTSTSKVKHQIVTEQVAPIAKRQYPVPYHQKPILQKEIARLLESNIIRESVSPWSAPVVLITKETPGGEQKIRMCIDYRGLNAVTKRDFYPLPNLQQSFDYFGKANLFSTLDVRSAYHQIDMVEGDKEKTAFSTLGEHWEFNKMPFGLVNSPSTFQRFINVTLSGLTGQICLAYLDDIIIFNSAGIDDHLEKLALVFERLRDANIKLKPDKCFLLMKQIKYLGHVISEDGIRPDSEKFIAVKNFPLPKSVKELRGFLGLVGWYRRFIPNFSIIAAPLTNLTKKSTDFKITADALTAINELKNAITSESVLAHPNFDHPFILATDACKIGIAGILSQVVNGYERPIAFFSKKLNKSQSNYSATELELYAVVESVKHFRCYLYGRKFTVISDHAPLKWLMTLKDPTSKLARWNLLLSSYDFEIVHRQGRKHGNVDALSRAPVDPQNFESYSLKNFFEYIKENKIENNNFREVKGNLFTAPDNYSLAHCVSKDFAMEQGLALQFRQLYGSINELKNQNKTVGEVAVLNLPERNIYCLITKSQYYNKPTYDSLWSALINLRLSCVQNDDYNVAIPKLGCGRDKLEWSTVSKMIKFIFAKSSIEILVYEFDQSQVSINAIEVNPPFLPVWDRDIILQEQKSDDFCRTICQNLEENEDPLSYYLDNDGLLFKTTVAENFNDVLVIPKTYIKKVLHDFHDLPFCGHMGQAKTLSLIQQRFFWPGMKSDVVKYCQQCHSCSQRKTSPHFKKVPLEQMPEVLYPFDRTSMDICGPFVTSYAGNKYLLTFQDHFSKYVEAFPISDQKADTIARIFVTEIIARHGTPKQLLTDQGSNFLSNLFKNICKLLHIEKLQTTPYHPQSNGLIERSHRVFKDIISHYVAKSQQDWDIWIPYVVMAYRFNIHSSTGFSPYFLLHGRDPVLPFDDILKPQVVKYDYDQNYVSELMARLNSVFTTVRQNLDSAKARQAINYNKRTKSKYFDLGQLVYLNDPTVQVGLSKKLGKPWIGPYRIIEVKGPVTYKIRKLNGRQELVVHSNRLKLCQTDEQNFLDNNEVIPVYDGNTPQIENVDDFGINPREVTMNIFPALTRVLPDVPEPQSDVQNEEELGTVIRDGKKVCTRIRKPPKRFTFSEYD